VTVRRDWHRDARGRPRGARARLQSQPGPGAAAGAEPLEALPALVTQAECRARPPGPRFCDRPGPAGPGAHQQTGHYLFY
jgi:hypothetical protein